MELKTKDAIHPLPEGRGLLANEDKFVAVGNT